VIAASSGISLLVAALDLKVVQLVRGAMAAADAQGIAGAAGAVVPTEPRFEPRQVVHPTPRYEPRPVIHPTPRYEPRPVVHSRPRVAELECPPCCEGEKPPCVPPPCLPPWMEPLPWPTPPERARVVKIVRRPPDIVHKGMLIDTFI
jgi:hypothetical protein